MKKLGQVFALGVLVASLGLALAWSTVPGQVKLADLYWNFLLETRLVDPGSYVGPHFWAVSVSPDGRRLAAGGMSRDVLLYDLDTGRPLPSPYRHSEWVMEVLWSDDGRWFASTSFAGEVVVQEDASGSVVYRSAGRDVAYTVAFHPDEPLLAWGAYDGTVRIVDISVGAEVRRFPAHEGGVLFVTWTPDGQVLASTGEDGKIRLWSTLDGSAVGVLEGHEAGITSVSFSPDGGRAVGGGDDATVRLWDVPTARALRVESPHRGWVNFSTFLPDGTGYLTVGTDPHVFVWSSDLKAAPQRLEGHDDWLMCVRVFPGGQRFVTTGKDGTARIWDVERLELLQSIDLWAGIDPGGMRWPAL